MQVFAVGREDLYAGRHIYDVQPILVVDGHGSRLLEQTRSQSAPPPSFFQTARGALMGVA
jgi:hypothetical protein